VIDDARERIAGVIRRENNVRERERAAEKASRQEARKYVLDARAEIERTIAELKKKGAAAADAAVDELGRDARRRAEELAAKLVDTESFAASTVLTAVCCAAPTTSGTVIITGPSETSRFTVKPGGTGEPASGL